MAESKLETAKLKLKQKASETKAALIRAKHWVEDNPIQTATICAVLASTVKSVSKHATALEERQKTNRKFYDPRTGFTVWSRRDLTADERDELEYRYQKNHESYNHILRDMRLLKE